MAAEATSQDWREGFLFVGDQLAIDFVNTYLEPDGLPTDLLSDWEAVTRWYAAAGLIADAAAQRLESKWNGTPEALQGVRMLLTFRDELRRSVSRIADGKGPLPAFTADLNRHLDAHPVRARLRVSGGRIWREPHFEPGRPDELIAPLAEAAASLLVDADPTRVRQCEGCVVYFYDASKNGLRRWCSMQACGNRAKVARYAERQRRARRRTR